ncbi:MAG: hypothetical protein RIC56_02115 [Pseudomonadales bacterium]
MSARTAITSIEAKPSSARRIHVAMRLVDTMTLQAAYPYLRGHVHFHMSGQDERNDFKYMLDLITDGLERKLAES